MNYSYSFVSDVELEKELLMNIKNRKLDQKFAYLWEWAKAFYEAYGNGDNVKTMDAQGEDEVKFPYFNFLTKNISKDKNIALINLWCWNWFQEKKLIEKMKKEGYKFSYFWVDCSKHMLELAQKNLWEITDVDKYFICADFTAHNFPEEIVNITRWFDLRIFSMLGYTFINTNQTNITDTLYNVLQKNDLLWFDILWREDDSKIHELQLFDRYSGYIQNPKMIEFWWSPLKLLWIPLINGKTTLQTTKEEAVGAILFTFYFVFIQKTIIEFRWQTFHFLPGETIEVYNIRNYNTDILSGFIQEHNFQLIDEEKTFIRPWLSATQFLFKK